MTQNNASIHPLRHISIRVPWHDNGWAGCVCKDPKRNGACLRLPRIASERVDEKEALIAGKSLQELKEELWPCCVPERAMCMAPFEYIRHARSEKGKLLNKLNYSRGDFGIIHEKVGPIH